MTQHYIVHTVSAPDGFGDLVYFMHWLKTFSQSNNLENSKIIIFARCNNKLIGIIKHFSENEPSHPIFKFLDFTHDSTTAKSKVSINRSRCVIKILPALGSFRCDVNITDFFPVIKEQDQISVIYVSCSYYTFKHYNNDIKNSLKILEFDASESRKDSLGLAEDNLGLLTDLDGITGTEDIDDLIKSLPETQKLQIFNDKDIAADAAKKFLIETPIVFAYFQRFVDVYVLHAVMLSPIISNAISKGIVPLFFITSDAPIEELPDVITKAVQNKKINLVISPWLKADVYKTLSNIFLHKDTYSIVIPSGDNSLTACIKSGKLPYYAHKGIKSSSDPEHFKCTIFSELQRIMQQALTAGTLPDTSGFNECSATLKALSTRDAMDSYYEKMRYYHPYIFNTFYASCIKSKKCVTYSNRGQYLTKAALDYFRDYVTPIIMPHFEFREKTLPLINKFLQKIEPAMPTADKLSTNFNSEHKNNVIAPTLSQC